MDYLAGTSVTILVLFRHQGQPIVPTGVTYDLYDADGTVLLTGQSVSTGPTDTQVSITINSTYNAISTSFEKRTLLVNYSYQSRPYTQRVVYRLTPFLNHTVTPQNVRDYLGVNTHELPDDQIDLVVAYFQIQEQITEAVFEEALAAGDLREIHANRAIVYQAALNGLPSLKQRIAQQETDGPRGFHRPRIVDFADLERTTRDLLGEALDIASEREVVNPTLLIVTLPLDPVTGA